jgi:hypothetical protein
MPAAIDYGYAAGARVYAPPNIHHTNEPRTNQTIAMPTAANRRPPRIDAARWSIGRPLRAGFSLDSRGGAYGFDISER